MCLCVFVVKCQKLIAAAGWQRIGRTVAVQHAAVLVAVCKSTQLWKLSAIKVSWFGIVQEISN